MRRPQNLKKLSHFFKLPGNKLEDYFKFLWSSQNIWTLKNTQTLSKNNIKILTLCSGITYLQVIWLGNGSKNEAQLHTIVEELPAEFPLVSTMGPSEFHWCPWPKLLTLLILLLFGSCKKGFCWIWSWRWVGGGTEGTGARVGTPLVP